MESTKLLGTSVAGIIFSEDRSQVLLIQRQDIPVWVLPGGGIDNGETPEEATVREMKEETGFDVVITRKVGDYYPANKITKFTYIFECNIIGGQKTTGEETKNIEYYPLSSLPKLMPPPYQEWIADAAKELSYPLSKTTESVTYFGLLKKFLAHPVFVMTFLLIQLKKKWFNLS